MNRRDGRVPALLLILAVGVPFLILNLFTATGFPIVWTDEVMCVDPAVNSVLGNGWTSTAWQSQGSHEFWAANNPLYPALQLPWLKIFGVSPVAVRSFNYVAMLLAVYLIWSAAQKAGWLCGSAWLLLFSALVLSSELICFIYRSGRPDTVGMVVGASLLRSWFVEDARRRRALIFAMGMLVLAAGMQMIPFVACIVLVDAILSRRFRPEAVALAMGIVAGGAMLAVVFHFAGALRAYLAATFASGYSLLGSTIQLLVFRDPAATARWKGQLSLVSPAGLWRAMTGDAALCCSTLVLLLAAIRERFAGSFSWRTPSGVGLILCLAVPSTMLLAGRYADYYSWMSLIPAALCACAALKRHRGDRAMVLLGLALLGYGAARGLPRLLYEHSLDASARDYSQVRRFLADNIRKDDWLMGDPALYYAAKASGIRFFSLTYAGGRGYRRPEEADRITVAIVQPKDLPEVEQKVAGSWKSTGAVLSTEHLVVRHFDTHRLPRYYKLAVYRK